MRGAKGNKGFTLVEVIVAMLMLAIIVVSVLSAFSSAAKTSLAAKKERSAETLAANVMEYAKSGGTEFAALFGGTEESLPGVSEGVMLRGVSEGFFSYDVTVEKDFDVVEYEKALLNEYQEVLLGSGEENVVFINLSQQGAAADEQAVETFYELHVQYVDNYNAERYAAWVALRNQQKAEIEAGVTPTPTPIPSPVSMLPKEKEGFPGRMTRELVLTAEEVSYGKLQLVAELSYTLSAEIEIPYGTEPAFRREVYRSPVYDSGNAVGGGTDCLDRVYVLYTPYEGGTSGTDIRVLDVNKILDTKLFLVWSEEARQVLGSDLFGQALAERTGGKALQLSFFSSEGHYYEPRHLEVYSSVTINEEVCASVEYHKHSLISKGQTKRIAAVKVRVLDPENGTVAAQVSSAYTK